MRSNRGKQPQRLAAEDVRFVGMVGMMSMTG